MILGGYNGIYISAYHDGMHFKIIRDAFDNGEDYIGFYHDKSGKRQRVLRDSLYGMHINTMMGDFNENKDNR